MIKAEVQWLQRNDLTRLDYDARYAAVGLPQSAGQWCGFVSLNPCNWLCRTLNSHCMAVFQTALTKGWGRT